MKRIPVALRHAAILSSLILLSSCGGGGGGGGFSTTTTPFKYRITWGTRTRSAVAPSSALSAKIVLAGAGSGGADLVTAVNRKSDPIGYTEDYVSPNAVRTGTYPMTISFYAEADGNGSVVGVAQATVTIHSDGSGIGDVTTTNRVASVVIPTGIELSPNETRQLTATALDAQSQTVAVTPGSVKWTLVDTTGALSLTPDGIATATSAGTAHVTATIDGVTSLSTALSMLGIPEFQNPSFEQPVLSPGEWKREDGLANSQWTGTHVFGIANGASAWGREGHSGAQYGFLQASTWENGLGAVEQTVGNFEIGRSYKVKFWVARRNGDSGANTGVPISLYADDVLIAGPTTPPTTATWSQITSEAFTATKTSYRFKFALTKPGGSYYDQSDLLDDVEVVKVP